MTKPTKTATRANTCLRLLLATCVATLVCLPVFARDNYQDTNHEDDETHYRQINLISDLFGIAQLQDTNLVNGWGISHSPTSPIWVSDNGTGKTTMYAVTNDSLGLPHVSIASRVVTIPNSGRVTGQLFNNTTAFNTNLFIFTSLDGTISGWRPALGNNAEVLATRNGAAYTGITLTTNNAGPILLLANFSEGTVDMYDAALRLVGRFADRRAPAGYAPYNVQNVAGVIFVTFAKQNANKNGLAPGRGRGLIDIFVAANGTFHRFATGKAAGGNVREMNSPWGVALAPATFGSHADQLLVGNFGSGTIMAFRADGKFRGLIKGSDECPVTIDGLWGLSFGAAGSAGVATDLYFTAGPNGETHGLFGVLQAEDDAANDEQDSRY